jgi:hypothetical protein
VPKLVVVALIYMLSVSVGSYYLDGMWTCFNNEETLLLCFM